MGESWYYLALLFLFLILLIPLLILFFKLKFRSYSKVISEEITNVRNKDQFEAFLQENKIPTDFKNVVIEINKIFEKQKKFFSLAERVISDLSRGVLGQTMEGDFKGDFLKMKDQINETSLILQQVIGEIVRVSTNVNQGAELVAKASQGLARGAMNQASSVEEVSSTVNEIKKQTKDTAENVKLANNLSTETSEWAREGNDKMKEMLVAMKDIGSSSESINKIIKVIDEIAFQTNLLSLNAAVEAARAGRHGKGFSVVAQEVRNLAQKSASAAKETTEMIQKSKIKVDLGVKTAQEVADFLDKIDDKAKKVKNYLDDIAKATLEQDEAVKQIGEALENIGQVTQTTAANIEQSSSGAQKLFAEADNLVSILGHFKVSESEQREGEKGKPKKIKSVGGGEYMSWSDQLSVGIDSIDQQHQVLLKLINKLHKSMKEGAATNVLKDIFNELVQYAATHFKYEEDLFMKYHYGDMENHIKIHKHLVGKVLEFKDQFDKGMTALSFDVMDFLKDWLINHIMGEDKKYTEHLTKNGVN